MAGNTQLNLPLGARQGGVSSTAATASGTILPTAVRRAQTRHIHPAHLVVSQPAEVDALHGAASFICPTLTEFATHGRSRKGRRSGICGDRRTSRPC